MGQPLERLLTYGSRLLLEHTQSLIALIDQSAGLIAWNSSLAHRLVLMPGAETLLQLLAPQSRPRCLELIAQALTTPTVDPIILNFANGPIGLPSSYHCRMIAIPTGELILLAEPMAALDQQAAEQYLQLTNDLAITTRSLQKTRHALEKKQHLLEDALLRLEHLVHIDDLTQLLNRRSIMQRLADETDRAKRYQSAVSLLLIDIDHFKQINDRYGHQAGDEVLQLCAGLLQRSIRTTDYLGRYGGEEFLCILPMTGVAAAIDLAERLRCRVERDRFTVSDTITFSLTVSVGVAEIDPQHDTTELLIAHADSALYEAKAHGRNCYALWRGV